MPVVTLSLPAAVGILAVVVIIAASIAFFSLRANAPEGTFETVETPTPTETPTATLPATSHDPANRYSHSYASTSL